MVVLGILLAGYAVIAGALFAGQRALIFPAPSSFPPVPAGYEQVTFRTADGLNLAGVWRAPSAGMPVALFFHGNGDSWAGGAEAVSSLAAAGYGVFLPEYRGYGGNPGSPSEQGFFGDGRAALRWLTERGVKPDDVVLIGNSIGSGTAAQLAVERHHAALILVSPFTSMPDVVAEKLPWLPARWLVRDAFDNAAKLGQIRAPILILHGTADALIPAAHSQKLLIANPAARLILVPDKGHELAYLPEAGTIQVHWLAALRPATQSP